MKERGFQVTVYEKDSSFGGKAKSLVVPSNGIACLPAEHGFRFFPGFYRHLIDALARIPVREVAGKYVVENLVTVREGVIAQADKRFSLFPTKGPQTVRAGVRFLRELLENPSLGLGAGEASFAALKLATAMTTCQERRTAELDDVTWWDYMCADNMSVTIEGWSSIALREILLPCMPSRPAYALR